MKINGSNVTIMVKNMDQSIRFYQNLGLELKQRWDNHYAMLAAEGITLGLHPSDGEKTGSGSTSIGFFIEKIEDAKALLQEHQIECNHEDDGKSGIYLHFTDPDGTILYFVQPKW